MKTLTSLFTFLIHAFLARAQSANNLPKLKLEKFASGFFAAMDIANCGDSRLFVAERLGKIWIVDSKGNKSDQPFLDTGR